MSNRTESYLVGLVGDGVMPSLTPPMHEREGDVQGLRYLYRPIDLLELGLSGESVGELLKSARDLGFNGLNITHPCKQLVLQHLDEVSPDARRLGAVNTVVIEDGRFIGHNTDFSGFAAALASGLPGAKLDRVVQLGAGGAGSAVAYALLSAGVRHLDLVDMDAARGAARAEELAGFFPDSTVAARTTAELPQLMRLADGLVHCTPVGMAAHPGVPLDLDLLEPRHWVADIVYRPIDTELVRAARAKGCEVLDGGRMAVGQAADAFRIFTGLHADPDRMRSHFLELVAAEEVAA
ncbi:shikimate dehydrogenase [Pseudarthrobacter phenanthrenivorans Sphe3]|uniref:Shikimate dehydrogenase (NADP(+)) n=1 Tax=Pseudarthrobacter phenanthrenivorans (strain DSM 18606 / JCM 16027 / LMG 23796 / Sphe3) TaxID=930171 RepID=F0M9C2_PSEPM|nr:shikimate dehydrogenase [Pseudarthrobacter phenanthrenivorans]ADX74976.1 shikimate dehydrogenase [Pseudarthrobacter phenanthrenivorans Sphe3]